MTHPLLLLACACALAACSPGAPQPAAPAPAALPASASPAPAALHTYRCDNGQTLLAAYPSTEAATVQYGGGTHQLRIALSGSGARYVGSGLQWWIKGSDGTLSRLGADGYGGESIAHCSEP